MQEISPNHPPAAQNVMATFETSGLEFLFPYPQLRPTYTSGVDVDLLMEPTRDFPGVIAPRVSFSCLEEYFAIYTLSVAIYCKNHDNIIVSWE